MAGKLWQKFYLKLVKVKINPNVPHLQIITYNMTFLKPNDGFPMKDARLKLWKLLVVLHCYCTFSIPASRDVEEHREGYK